MLAVISAGASIAVLYAEIANFVGYENNIIYDMVILAPDYDSKSASYIWVNVRLYNFDLLLQNVDFLFDSAGIPSVCY